jgi:glycosyltransferase involved in cell wall biosynthesis
MRLAICSAGELFGGVERQILDLCTYWRRTHDVDPLVIIFHDHELAAQLRGRGIEPVVLLGGKYDIRLAGRVADLVRRHGIDVVHVHGYRAMITCALARERVAFRIVKTEHGLPETGGGTLLTRTRTRLNARLDQLFTRRRADAVCYVTRDIASKYDAIHAGLDRYYVPNGIDPLNRDDYPCPPELQQPGVHIGMVGRVSAVKAVDVAIKAFAQVDPVLGARLWIIGTGPLLEEMKGLARELGVAERVRFLGFKANVYDYLAHLDILLMPSWHEGLPYTLLEGMSLGRAFVVSRVGGLQEVLDDGGTALLVGAGDAPGLGAALMSLARDQEQRSRLGTAAFGEQRQSYTLECMGGSYEDICSGRTDQERRASRLSK